MPTRSFVSAALICLLGTLPAWGHPGHGNQGGDYSLAHHLTEPLHLAVAAGAFAAVAAVAVTIRLLVPTFFGFARARR